MSLPLASGTNSKGAHHVSWGYDYKKGQLQHGFQRLSCRFFSKESAATTPMASLSATVPNNLSTVPEAATTK